MFESRFVGNPEDSFCRVKAHITVIGLNADTVYACLAPRGYKTF